MDDLMVTPSRSEAADANPLHEVETVGNVTIYLLVQAENQVDLAGLVSGVNHIPGVLSATRVVGPYDVIAEAAGPTEEARTSLAAAVGSIPGVIRVVTVASASVAGGSNDTPWAA